MGYWISPKQMMPKELQEYSTGDRVSQNVLATIKKPGKQTEVVVCRIKNGQWVTDTKDAEVIAWQLAPYPSFRDIEEAELFKDEECQQYLNETINSACELYKLLNKLKGKLSKHSENIVACAKVGMLADEIFDFVGKLNDFFLDNSFI